MSDVLITKIVLVRHGETEWSLSGNHTGLTDLPLTENGERQAERLRAVLEGTSFTHVFTSPLLRAQRTCALSGLSAQAVLMPDLHEWDYGDYEGLTTPEVLEQNPEWNMFKDGCPGGESLEQIARRADEVIRQVSALAGTVALFSHAHFLRALAMRWIGLDLICARHFLLDTASISILEYEHPDKVLPAISLWNAGTNPLALDPIVQDSSSPAQPDSKGLLPNKKGEDYDV